MPKFKPGQSGNPGGKPRGTSQFRFRCRLVAERLLTELENRMDNFGADDLDSLLRAFTVLAPYGGYISAEREAQLILRALAVPTLTAEDRATLLATWKTEQSKETLEIEGKVDDDDQGNS